MRDLIVVDILDGNIPHGFPLQNVITPEAPGFITSPKLMHKVHVIFMLVGADMATDGGYLGRIREFRDLARARGLPNYSMHLFNNLN